MPEALNPEQSPDLTPHQQKGLRRARKKASQFLEERDRTLQLASKAYKKLNKDPNRLAQVRGEVGTMTRLVRAWARRHYRRVPWRALLYTVAALLYFVNPADVIPDALLGIGFVDDLAVLTAVIKAVREELDAFVAWENEADQLGPDASPELLSS